MTDIQMQGKNRKFIKKIKGERYNVGYMLKTWKAGAGNSTIKD